MRNPRVLVVDDEPVTLKYLGANLRVRGYEVLTAPDGETALEMLGQSEVDLIILDIMMPGMDGLTLCRLIRDKTAVPILMLTARDSVPDRVAGLDAGADDYLVKPFAFDELVARIQALLRRARPEPGKSERLTYANLTLDRKSWAVVHEGEPLTLTAKEFRLLEHFMCSPEQVLTREEILTAIWGEEWLATDSNVVDVHIANLRQKLEAGGRPRLIRTVRGAGYMLKEE
jgi:two-component system response regulator MprA